MSDSKWNTSKTLTGKTVRHGFTLRMALHINCF